MLKNRIALLLIVVCTLIGAKVIPSNENEHVISVTKYKNVTFVLYEKLDDPMSYKDSYVVFSTSQNRIEVSEVLTEQARIIIINQVIKSDFESISSSGIYNEEDLKRIYDRMMDNYKKISYIVFPKKINNQNIVFEVYYQSSQMPGGQWMREITIPYSYDKVFEQHDVENNVYDVFVYERTKRIARVRIDGTGNTTSGQAFHPGGARNSSTCNAFGLPKDWEASK